MNLTEQARQLIELKEAILAELKERDTGRWRWDRIHCCVTGKDADLEPWGQQGIELVSVNATTVTFYVHLGITYAGTDVSLNLPEDLELQEDMKCLDAYLRQAQEVVCSAPGNGSWDGDSWYFSETISCRSVVRYKALTTDFDVAATVDAMFDEFNSAVEPWDREAAGVSETLRQLAGWHNADGTKCEPGKPTCAAWMPFNEGEDDEQDGQ